MAVTSHCGLGQTAPASAMDALRAFPEAFRRRFSGTAFQPAFSLDDALEEARALTGRDDAQAHF
jgi:[NiFe] hydrogenase diaphorase moiety large subunit